MQIQGMIINKIKILVSVILFIGMITTINSFTCHSNKKISRCIRSNLLHVNSKLHLSTITEAVATEYEINPSVMPSKFKSSFLETLRERGYIHQCTDYKGLDDKFCNDTVSAYLGFDATATSLHVGSLLQIMILRNLQKAGHKPIILIGGGTTKVGDPSGKDESRQLLTEDIIKSNSNSIAQIFKKFIIFGNGPSDAIMVNNADWLDNINYLSFLRDYGRFFTINRMLSFESVKQRLAREQPLTFLEFNYMLLQAYDFLELNRRHKASLQLGGSDQWGNIISGVELGRKVDQVTLYGLTAPLITTSDGKKMGKTASGAMWLNKELLSEFEYWQFWRNTADTDVIRFLKLFTEVSMDEINVMAAWEGSDLNKAKIKLADECVSLLHGKECLPVIHATAASLYGGSDGSNLDSLENIVLEDEICSNISTNNGSVSVVEMLIKASMAASKSEARRLIKGGGARVNDVKVTDENAVVLLDSFDSIGRLKLSSGKKKHVVMSIKK